MSNAKVQVPCRRKPRFIDYDGRIPNKEEVVARRGVFADAQRDDVIRASNGEKALVERFTQDPDWNLNFDWDAHLDIPLEYTEEHDDPMDWFSDIIAELDSAHIMFSVSCKFIQRRLPGLDQRWYKIGADISWGRLEQLAYMFFSPVSGHQEQFRFDDVAVDADETHKTVKRLHACYAASMQPRVTLLCAAAPADIFPRFFRQSNLQLLLLEHDVHSDQPVVIAGRRFDVTEQPFNLYQRKCLLSERASVIAELQDSPHFELIKCQAIDQEIVVDRLDDYTLELSSRWAFGSEWRTPRPHSDILDVCLAFASLSLPPYVLLEILDWFPSIECRQRLWKIRLIQGVRDSVWRVLQARPHARQTFLKKDE